jgi:hypothetical protein
MKAWKRSGRAFLLFMVLILGAAMALSPLGTEVADASPADEWTCTDEAKARTAAGDCGSDGVCLELCVNFTPTGLFECFPKWERSCL